MNKVDAIKKLKAKKDAIENIKKLNKDAEEFRKWKRDTRVCLEKIFGSEANHVKEFTLIRYSSGISSYYGPKIPYNPAEYFGGLERASSLLQSFIDEIEEYWSDSEDLDKKNESVSAVALIEKLCRRFHIVARQLRFRHDSRDTLNVSDEYDVQDLIHALLLIYFDDVRKEEWTPSYAGGSSRMDFLIKDKQIVIEIKKSRKGLGARELGEQLIVDIEKYKSHPDCKKLFCFAYDPEGIIANPRGIENDLSKAKDDIEVKVIIAP